MEIHPVTPDRWDDLLELFGPGGAYWNCWCTWWILTGKEFAQATPEERKKLLAGLVANGSEPGLLAYREGNPVGWCAVGPRTRYTRMMSPRSRVYRPFPDPEAEGNWVVNCFFIARKQRGQGIAAALLDEAVKFAWARGARTIDGYPLLDDSPGASPSPASLYVGSVSMFRQAGFREVNRVNNRPLMRLTAG
ncbi:MAG TPA: GNAT family N-acetyltransferase [Acidimicrobiia bacterium]|nr:GNAT family N-acetyltransferase [Acidimicrobiia bacterium]